MKPENNQLTVLKNEQGAIGYVVAWLLGVPAGLLVFVFLLTRLF